MALTTANLALKHNLSTKEFEDILIDSDFVYKKNNNLYLTQKGKAAGGAPRTTESGHPWILWPDDFNPLEKEGVSQNSNYVNATKIGDFFNVSNQRVNNILAELGWIEAAIKGWKITYQGKNIGGLQKELQSGAKYVIWPELILTNQFFLKAIKPLEYSNPKRTIEDSQIVDNKNENKYPESQLKAKDGHIVKSRAELIIDNLLYDYGLLHAYERELTVAEIIKSDFYIPARDGRKAVYIEYWGIKDNLKYTERKKHKLEIYKTLKLNLIELEEKHLENIDSYLRKALLTYDIDVE